MYARALTWWTILRICIEERLVYRGDFALGTLMRFLPIVTQVFFWGAIFAAAGKSKLAGYSENEFIAYFLLTMITRAFSSMPGLASGVAREVREGTIKKYLIQPIDLVGFLLLSRIAHKLVYYVVALLPFVLVFYLCRGYFEDGWPDAKTMAAYLASLLMAFLLGFFLECAIGMISFWFLEVSSLLFVYMLFNFILSGHMFPLEVLEEIEGPLGATIRGVVDFLPLKYLAYFPSAVFLGKVTGEELVRGLLMQFAWLMFFIVVCRTAYARGVKRYSGYGG